MTTQHFLKILRTQVLKLVSKPIPPEFSSTFVCILMYTVCRFAANCRGKNPVFTHPEVILKKISMSHWVAYWDHIRFQTNVNFE